MPGEPRTGSRPYYPGEDRQKAREGVIVCQAGGANGRLRICNGPVRKVGRFMVGGHWADEYECERQAGHRFTLWGEGSGRRCADVPRSAPEFGQP